MLPRLFAALALLCALSPPAYGAPVIGPSGLAVPRYESLKFGEVNGRLGPSMEHRVLWTYHRRGLPVRVIAESDVWRQVADPAGDVAWVHVAGLSPKRTVFVAGGTETALRAAPRPEARPVARLGPGVVGVLEACRAGWRKVRVNNYSGWIETSALWGGETCDPKAPS
ncbi:MAG: SH3 domain-containing protein [Hyphomonadaceae bacterium]